MAKLRWQFYDFASPYIGQVASAAAVDDIARRVTNKLRVSKDKLESVAVLANHNLPAYNAVSAVVRRELLGLDVTDALAERLSIMLAGNVPLLRAGMVPEVRPDIVEWAMVEVVDSRWHRTAVKKLSGGVLSLLVWTGSAAGRVIEQFFTNTAMNRLAREIGMVPKRPYKHVHYRELVRMKFMAQLEVSDSIVIQQYKDKPSLKARNRHRRVSRSDKTGCIFESELPCHFCPKGYEVCVNGTHRKDFVKKSCYNGHDGWFDPSGRESLCLACIAHKQWRIGE
jgi:hypothetical protein